MLLVLFFCCLSVFRLVLYSLSTCSVHHVCGFFFVNDTSTPESYPYGHTFSLHDALPISSPPRARGPSAVRPILDRRAAWPRRRTRPRARSEEHTSELQSLMRTSYAVFC